MKLYETGIVNKPESCKECPHFHSGGRADRRATGCYASQDEKPDFLMRKFVFSKGVHPDCPLECVKVWRAVKRS